MKVVTRDQVRGPSGECKACGTTTRSHILEPAKYEEFELVTEEEHEEYQNKVHEETGEEEIELRYRLLERPTVMCHRCWLQFREAQIVLLEDNSSEWHGDISNYIPEIKVFLKRWRYHDFAHECSKEGITKVRELRHAIKEAMTNVE